MLFCSLADLCDSVPSRIFAFLRVATRLHASAPPLVSWPCHSHAHHFRTFRSTSFAFLLPATPFHLFAVQSLAFPFHSQSSLFYPIMLARNCLCSPAAFFFRMPSSGICNSTQVLTIRSLVLVSTFRLSVLMLEV